MLAEKKSIPNPVISCVVPVYNESANIAAFIEALHEHLTALDDDFEIIVVDDGSTDDSAGIARGFVDSLGIKLLSFSRNFGKEAALSAGLDYAEGDAVIMIDADFQHPVAVIDTFIAKWREGYDMVYGVQNNRNYMSRARRLLSEAFYSLMSRISSVSMPPGAGDFRLLDRKVVKAIRSMPEKQRIMKGLYAWVGFQSCGVHYDVSERQTGSSRFSFKKLYMLARTGIVTFSDLPLRIWGFIGFFIALISLFYALWIVADTLLFGVDVPGWATVVVAVTFLGGLQLLSIGILGEYIASIFNEAKHRPLYLVAEEYGFEVDSQVQELAVRDKKRPAGSMPK